MVPKVEKENRMGSGDPSKARKPVLPHILAECPKYNFMFAPPLDRVRGTFALPSITLI